METSSSSVSSVLLQQVRRRDREAWRRLVHLFSPLVYDWCRRQNLQAADSADVLQEVFQSVLQNLGGFRREKPGDSFRGWLWTITRNKIRDFRRTRRARGGGGSEAWRRMQELPEQEPPSDSGDGESRVSVSPLRRALETIRQDFGETTWRAFWRIAVENRPAAEVAEELQISVNAVRKAKARVLRRLREEFGELLE